MNTNTSWFLFQMKLPHSGNEWTWKCHEVSPKKKSVIFKSNQLRGCLNLSFPTALTGRQLKQSVKVFHNLKVMGGKVMGQMRNSQNKRTKPSVSQGKLNILNLKSWRWMENDFATGNAGGMVSAQNGWIHPWRFTIEHWKWWFGRWFSFSIGWL